MGTSRVVVTGAAGALGGVVATHFLMAGHPVVLVDRDEAALRQAYADTPGDMAFVAAELVLVVSEAGDGYLLDLSDNSRDEVPITGLPGEITGLAFDADDRLWASTRKGTLLRILVDWTGSTPAFTVDATQVHELRTDDEPSGIPIDDLAPVVVPPEGCS